MRLESPAYFVYGESVNVSATPGLEQEERADAAVSRIAAAMGEPARTRMLFCLMDGHARTSTELAMVADVSPSTASVHLNRLMAENLVKVAAQGRHRYLSLAGPRVARALESLSVLAGAKSAKFEPNTPSRLRGARSCYDHMAGALAVALHDRMLATGWLAVTSKKGGIAYDVTPSGARSLSGLGIDVAAAKTLRRRFAYACLDWSERRPHLGGALGAVLLNLALQRKWVARELDSRALSVTRLGQRELLARFEIAL